MPRPWLTFPALLLLAVSAAHGGLIVDSVIPDGPAAAAGLRAGDRLLRLAGQQLETMDDLERITRAHRPGDKVKLVVERDGAKVKLRLVFGERPGGGVSIGVHLAIASGPSDQPYPGTVECLAWIEQTYRIAPSIEELELEWPAVFSPRRVRRKP